MATKSRITVVASRTDELSCSVIINNLKYFVQTEDMGSRSSQMISRVYLNGEVVFTRKSDYSHIPKHKDFDAKLKSSLVTLHKNTVDLFVKEKSKPKEPGEEFFGEIRYLIKKGNGNSALTMIRSAAENFRSDPFLMSYYGCLIATIENNAREGIKICREAIKQLDKVMPIGREFHYPVFYLNLGKAYLKDGNKEEAIRAFGEGLKHDPGNRDLVWEMQKLGNRRKPVIPLMERSHPVNKFLGKLLHKGSK